jgi:hypothetical protein
MKKLLLSVAMVGLTVGSAHAMNISLNCVPTEFSIHVDGEQP